MTKTLVILGAGGHGRVVADAALAAGGWTRVVATDRNPAKCHGDLLPAVTLLALEQALALAGAEFHVAIGSADAREQETRQLADRPLATVIHPAATVSPCAEIGSGSFIAARCIVAPGARLGDGVIANHGAVVDHDVQVGAFSHIAPLAALGGDVRIGARALVGTGACVLPGVRICAAAVIGAGAVVCAPVTEAGVYAGVPARRVR